MLAQRGCERVWDWDEDEDEMGMGLGMSMGMGWLRSRGSSHYQSPSRSLKESVCFTDFYVHDTHMLESDASASASPGYQGSGLAD